MSVQLIARVWADPYFTQAQKTELLVALALADFARKEDGKAWPSIDTLAMKARTSVRCAQIACKALQVAGKLKVQPGGGQNGTNAYYLLYTPAADAPPAPHGVHSSPRNGLSGELPKELADGCTQTVRNHQESPGTVMEPSSPPEAGEGEAMCGFDEFWRAYPKKRDKSDAEKAWRTHHCETVADTILAAVRTWGETFDWKKDDGQFVPYPGKWLRRRGWEDEPPRPRSGSPRTFSASPYNAPAYGSGSAPPRYGDGPL